MDCRDGGHGGQPQQQERFRGASQYNRAQNLKLAFVDGLSTPVIQALLALALATGAGAMVPLPLGMARRLPLERLLQVWDALSKAGIRINEVPARIKAGGE